MHIFFVAPANSIHAYRWIDFFRRAGCDITWVSLQPAEASLLEAYPQLAPEHYRPTPVGALNALLSPFHLWRRLKRVRPDVLHAHSVARYGIVSALTRFQPFVATAWGSDVLVAGKSSSLGWLVRFVLRSAKAITCDADHMIEAMSAMGVDHARIRRINFGIDTDALLGLASPDPEYSAKFRGPDAAPVIISLRNHYEVYDVGTLLRAVPAIRERIPNVRVIVAGRGPETDKLKSLAGELALGESVQFIGGYNGEHLQRMFSAVDVYVSTSLSDAGIAASTAEAMACGVPAVISNTGENDQWVRDGENGFLFAAGDHATLAKRVVELLGDHAVRAKLGQAGRGTVIENNSYRREMGKMLKLYQDVTGLTHAPPADAAELRRS